MATHLQSLNQAGKDWIVVGRVDAGQQECCWNLFKGRLHDTGPRRRGALHAKRSQTVKDLLVGLGQDPLRSKVEEQGGESEKERAGGMPGRRSCGHSREKKGVGERLRGRVFCALAGEEAEQGARRRESRLTRKGAFLHVHKKEMKPSEERAGPQCWTSASV